jgi:hypothetical protein
VGASLGAQGCGILRLSKGTSVTNKIHSMTESSQGGRSHVQWQANSKPRLKVLMYLVQSPGAASAHLPPPPSSHPFQFLTYPRHVPLSSLHRRNRGMPLLVFDPIIGTAESRYSSYRSCLTLAVV